MTMQVLKCKHLSRTRFLNLNESEYEDNTGKSRVWAWAERPNNTNAVVVAAMVRGLLVVIKEFRVPLNSYVYELPAGLVENGENPVDAGKREFLEETGYRITRMLRPLSPLVYNSPGLTSEGCYLMFAEASDSNVEPRHGDSEDISIMRMSYTDVNKLMRSGEKIGAKAYLIFLQYLYECQGRLWQPQDR